MEKRNDNSDTVKRVTGWMSQTITAAEILIAVVMLVIIFLGLGYLLVDLFKASSTGILLDQHEILALLDITLVLFIVVELFRITMAYLRGERVLATVMEAAFVAVGRKVILYDFKAQGIYGAIALTVLLAVLIAAHYLFRDRPARGKQ